MERRVNTKVSCTVWSRGKSGDHIKALPIAIGVEWKPHEEWDEGEKIGK